MASIRALASCIGIPLADISMLRDFLGFEPGTLPTDPTGATVSISLKRQADRLEGPHFHVNVIRIGSDQFTESDENEIAMAIYKMRDIYDQVGIGVGRILHSGVPTINAFLLDTPMTEAALVRITEIWTVPNNGIDLFIPHNVIVPGAPLGLAPIFGPDEGDKIDQDRMSGAVSGLWGDRCGQSASGTAVAETARTVSHELGHYLGLPHANSLATNIMCQTASATNSCTSSVLLDLQGAVAITHPLTAPGC